MSDCQLSYIELTGSDSSIDIVRTQSGSYYTSERYKKERGEHGNQKFTDRIYSSGSIVVVVMLLGQLDWLWQPSRRRRC